MKADPDKNNDALKKVEESFIGNTLTLVSIIEGVALVILADRTKEFIEHYWNTYDTVGRIVHLSYVLLSFMNIIVTTYLYLSQLSVFRRHSTIYDVVFPFLVGAVQIAQFHFFKEINYWWICMDLMCFLGIYGFHKNKALIYSYSLKKDLPIYYRNAVEELLKNFRFLTSSVVVYAIAYSLLTVLLFIFEIKETVSVFFLIPLVVSNIYTFYHLSMGQNKMLKYFK